MITYTSASAHLPAGSIEFIGNNQVKANFSQITGNTTLTLDSSMIQGISKFLDGLAVLTSAINSDRASLTPPLPPIKFVSKALSGGPDNPEIHYTLVVDVDNSAFLNNLVDPTQ